MKIFWASPFGAGWAIAETLRNAGNKVVYFNPSGNKNGLGFLPEATVSNWQDYAKKADLIVVDDNFRSRQTRRSFTPSDFIYGIAALRARGMTYVGPTPTTELLEWDRRYCRKVLARVGIESIREDDVLPITVSRDPDGRCYLVLRSLGQESNLGDTILPISGRDPLCQHLEPLHRFLDSIKCTTYVNTHLEVGRQHLDIRAIQCRFLYPAIFVQLSALLRSAGLRLGNHSEESSGGRAVTLLAMNTETPQSLEHLIQAPGIFGADLHRDGDGRAIAHGPILGALARVGPLAEVVQELHRENSRLLQQRDGARTEDPVLTFDQINCVVSSLVQWGWLLKDVPALADRVP